MKKRLLLLLTIFVAGALGYTLNAQTIGSTDVTNTYLTNPGFESCTVTTTNKAAGGSAAPTAINGEWTQNASAAWSSSAVVAYGGSGQVNGASAPSADNAGNTGNTLGVSVGWGGTVTYQSAAFTLPAGSYVIKVYGYNNLSGVTQFKSLFGFVPTSGTSTLSSKASFAYATWSNDEISFTLTAATEGKIQVGGQAVSGGSGSNAKVFFDNVTILYNDPALAAKLVELKGVIKKAKALNGILNNSELASKITTVEATNYTTVADMQDDIDAIEAYYNNLQTITLINADFDTNPNIALDGTNSASFITPATAAKPYIYPVEGWTQNFTFNSTASQGNTAVYGATISGDNGTNSTNPPATDMFGKTAGAALHLSSGWSDQARYKQDLANLPAGRYIIYYEANNQNSTATAINSNYFGVGDIESGNLKGSNNTFVYADLKTYPYNDWVASATPFNLIDTEEAATMHVGVVGTTGGSASAAKLWIDNVTLYYLGYDPTQIISDINTMLTTAETLLDSQMNQDVKAALVTATTSAQNAINNSASTYDVLAPAEHNLETAIADAQASAAVYANIATQLALLTAESQRGGITETQIKALPFYTKYSDGVVNETADNTTGTYTTLDEVIPLYKANIAAFWAENKAADADMTAFIVNQGFEFGNTDNWSVTNSSDTGVRENANATYTTQGVEGVYLFNTWWQGTPITQAMTNLPNGTYRLTASLASSNDDADAKLYLIANGSHSDVITITQGTARQFNDYSFDFVVTDGNATIGAVGGTDAGEYVAGGHWWYKADNFRLTFLSEDMTVKPTIPTGLMNAEVQTALNDAEDAFDTTPSAENYNALLAAIDAANASIAVYQTMNKYITAQKATAATLDWTGIDNKYTTGQYVNATDFIDDYKALVVAALGTTTTADTDMTPYIINASFEFGDTSNWAHYSNGDSGAKENSNATYTMSNVDGTYLFNTWNNNTEGKYVFQDLTNLPNGTYQVTAVFGSDADNVINLTAQSGSNEQAETFSTGEAKTVGVEKTVQIVVNNGNLRFGANSNAWFKVDNFRLTFLSDQATLKPTVPEGKMNADVQTALDTAEANYDTTPSVENYNALLTAINNANASIAVYQNIASRLEKLQTTMGDIDSEDAATFTAFTNYDNGVYTSFDEVMPLYNANVSDFWATNVAADKDLSAFIVNPGFEYGDFTGWNVPGSNDTSLKNDAGLDAGTSVFNAWTNNPGTYPSLMLTQQISGLPNGTYKIQAGLVSSRPNATLYANTGHTDITTLSETWTSFEAVGVVSNGTLTIKVYQEAQNNLVYFRADNFKLFYVSSELPQEYLDEAAGLASIDTTQPMNAAEKAAYEAARDAWNGGDHSPEAYQALVETAPVAENSIAAYVKALAAINEVFSVLTETNVYTIEGYNALFKTYNNYKRDYENGLLADDVAATIRQAIFGNRTFHQLGVAVVPFLGSAWDDQGDYTWTGNTEKHEFFEENYFNYWVNTWSGEGDTEGSDFTVPFMEYWTNDSKTLTDRELTATVSTAPHETYTVSGFFRARVAGSATSGTAPTGIKLVLVDDDDVEYGPDYQDTGDDTLVWAQQAITNTDIQWTQVEGTDFWIAHYSTKGHTTGDANGTSATDGGALTTLRIKFVFENTNASWFAFKNMMYNPSHTVDAYDYAQLMDDMDAAILYAESHTLGFDFQGEGGFATKPEYAPWANAKNLEDLELLKNYKAAITALMTQYGYDATTQQVSDNDAFMAAAPRYILVNNLIKTVANAEWVENTNEMNAIYWRIDYTTDDVDVLQYYLADGSKGGTYYTIAPTGWDLFGRFDAYSTRVIKNKVNTTIFPTDQLENKAGMWAVKGQTVLFVKWDTNYGEDTGYTLPLKPGVKYAFQFNYADWGDGVSAETNIEIINRRTGNRVDVTDFSGSAMEAPNNVNKFTLKGKGQQGDKNEENWYMYRGEFTTEAGANYTDDYIIYLKKTINERQMQIALGEITLVRAPGEEDIYYINGQTTDEADDFTPPFEYEAMKKAVVTRNFNYNDGEGGGVWNTFVLPFKMDQLETEAMLGEGISLAYYKGCTLEGTTYNLDFESHKAGVLSNVPTMVYFTEAHNLTDYEVPYAIIRGNNDKPETIDPNGLLDLVGTYKIVQTSVGDVYVNAKNLWKISKGTTKMQPSRAYFKNVSGDPELGAKLMGFRIDEVATGIMAIEEDGEMHVTSGNIYTVEGRLVRQNAKSLEGLTPGIYVVDGKKYIVK